MRKQVVVIGMGRFGVSIASTLFEMGHDVLAMDTDEKKVQAISPKVTRAVQADATNETILKELGITNFDAAVVAVGSQIENNVLCTILLKKMGVRYVVARAENELHGSILDKIGADKVVYPEREMGTMLAHALTLTDVVNYMPVATRFGVASLAIPAYFVGKTLSELDLGRAGKWGVAVLLIQRGKEVIVTPDRLEIIKPGDVLVVSGYDYKLEELLNEARAQSVGK
ncbi:MAG: hypothetical protein A2Y91_01100 [Chloroflexi bacterium RBG_13_54_8]|nr:MAG: hypothetical protein A2Y91_01100 [Chloroflexi bacterium RBG_13_54_8]